jgi:hypothetical protein
MRGDVKIKQLIRVAFNRVGLDIRRSAFGRDALYIIPFDNCPSHTHSAD